jgi:pimeloyl-ACP methyl ester carboxylesterase
MTEIRVYPYYGFIGAPFPRGVNYSRGVNVVCDRLAEIPGVSVLRGRANWLAHWRYAAHARAHPNVKHVAIGHSMGVYAITQLAAKTPDVTWDLLLAFEPVPAYGTAGLWRCAPLGANVKKALVFRSTNWLNPIGHGYLTPAPDFSGELRTIPVRRLHQNVPNGPAVQAMCVEAVKELVDA